MRGELIVKPVRIMLVALLIMNGADALAGTPSKSPSKSSVPAADEAAIQAAVGQLVRGWNSKDAELFSRPFAPDVDYVAINGLKLKGHKTVTEGHRHIFATVHKETTIALTVQHIRMLGPAHAVVHVAGTNRGKQGGQFRQIDMVLSMVMAKTGDSWRIVAFQNTRIEPNAGQGPPPGR
jgi:uncharacterized protein (TIGR02246 family)